MKKEKVLKIKKRIEELEEILWTINLIDHWTRQDRESYEKYNKELTEIKQLLIKEVLE